MIAVPRSSPPRAARASKARSTSGFARTSWCASSADSVCGAGGTCAGVYLNTYQQSQLFGAHKRRRVRINLVEEHGKHACGRGEAALRRAPRRVVGRHHWGVVWQRTTHRHPARVHVNLDEVVAAAAAAALGLHLAHGSTGQANSNQKSS